MHSKCHPLTAKQKQGKQNKTSLPITPYEVYICQESSLRHNKTGRKRYNLKVQSNNPKQSEK
jgi:hypothetical protein